VKRRYQGVCRGCGAPTARGGKGDAHESCKGCHPGRSHRPGHATGCAARCATGASDTAGHRRQPTGLAHTPPGAVARHSNAWATVAGRHPPRSSTCTGPGLRPWPTPFQRSNPPTERGGRFPAGPVPISRDGKAARSARPRSRPRQPASGRLARAHRREPDVSARAARQRMHRPAGAARADRQRARRDQRPRRCRQRPGRVGTWTGCGSTPPAGAYASCR